EIEAGRDRELVTEVARELDRAEAIVRAARVDDQPVAAVAAPVVDEDDLGRPVEALHQRPEPRQELGQALLLVVDRDDEGIGGRSHGPIIRTTPWAGSSPAPTTCR